MSSLDMKLKIALAMMPQIKCDQRSRNTLLLRADAQNPDNLGTSNIAVCAYVHRYSEKRTPKFPAEFSSVLFGRPIHLIVMAFFTAERVSVQ